MSLFLDVIDEITKPYRDTQGRFKLTGDPPLFQGGKLLPVERRSINVVST